MIQEAGSARVVDDHGTVVCGFMPVTSCSSRSTRRFTRGLARALLMAGSLLALPALAADLQLTDLSDSGYDPVPAGSDVVYGITLENGAGDTSAATSSIFDLPAGTTASSLPAFCAAAVGTPTRIVCNHGPLQGTLAGGSPVTFQIGVDTGGQAPGTVTMRGAVGFSANTPPATTPIASLTVADPFFASDTNTANNIRSQATTLTVAGDLRLQKSATPNPVVGGGEVTYTLTVG